MTIRRMTDDQIAHWEANKARRRVERKQEHAATPRQTPVVAFSRPRCPACRSVDCVVQRTDQSDSELLQQRLKCRTCGQTFVGISD